MPTCAAVGRKPSQNWQSMRRPTRAEGARLLRHASDREGNQAITGAAVERGAQDKWRARTDSRSIFLISSISIWRHSAFIHATANNFADGTHEDQHQDQHNELQRAFDLLVEAEMRLPILLSPFSLCLIGPHKAVGADRAAIP